MRNRGREALIAFGDATDGFASGAPTSFACSNDKYSCDTAPQDHSARDTSHSNGYRLEFMRLLLAILAVVGLLLSPAAASAAALSCVHEHSAMEMTYAAPVAAGQGAMDHSCCDEAGKTSDQDGKSGKHDAKACAQACATMCAVSAALHVGTELTAPSPLASELVAATATGIRPFAPPGLKRPPRSIA